MLPTEELPLAVSLVGPHDLAELEGPGAFPREKGKRQIPSYRQIPESQVSNLALMKECTLG